MGVEHVNTAVPAHVGFSNTKNETIPVGSNPRDNVQHYHVDSTRPGSSHSQYSKNRHAPERPCLQALLRFRMATESISLHHFILKPMEPTIGSYIMMETRTTILPPHPAELRHRR